MQIFTLFAYLVLGEGEPVLKLPEEKEHRLRTAAEELHQTENSNHGDDLNVMMTIVMMMMVMMMIQT